MDGLLLGTEVAVFISDVSSNSSNFNIEPLKSLVGMDDLEMCI